MRYIRVNQLKISKNDLIEKVTENQFSLKKYSKKQTTFESFMKLALELEPRQFLVDYHFDDILVFRNDDIKSLTDLEIYKEENLFAIQDKVCFHSLLLYILLILFAFSQVCLQLKLWLSYQE